MTFLNNEINIMEKPTMTKNTRWANCQKNVDMDILDIVRKSGTKHESLF